MLRAKREPCVFAFKTVRVFVKQNLGLFLLFEIDLRTLLSLSRNLVLLLPQLALSTFCEPCVILISKAHRSVEDDCEKS